MAKVLWLENEKWQVEKSVLRVLEVEYGYQLTLCAGLDDAAHELKTTRFDVVVFDIMMRMDAPIVHSESAFALVDSIRNGLFEEAGNPPSLPLVFATGVQEMEMTWKDGSRITVAEAILRTGIPRAQCVSKPFSADTIDAAIQTVSASPNHHQEDDCNGD